MMNNTRKYLAATMGATILLTSCGSASSNSVGGGFMGAQLGSILGEAIGFISGGPRGGDVGTIVGSASGFSSSVRACVISVSETSSLSCLLLAEGEQQTVVASMETIIGADNVSVPLAIRLKA